MEISSHILVCKDLDLLNSHITQNYSKNNLKIFLKDDFLIEDAKAVVKEAYIAESDTKVIAMISKSYNIYAQNSLLKIIEEPPRNIVFILGIPSKTILLPTMRSRLSVKNIKLEEEIIKTGIDYKRLDIALIYEFLKDKKNLDKSSTKILLQNILSEAIEQGIRLDDSEMNIFTQTIHLAELNSRSSYLCLCALLVILNRKNR